MSQLHIEVSSQEYQKLQAIAAKYNQSVEDYVKSSALENTDFEFDLTEEEKTKLYNYLKPGIEEARAGNYSTRTIDDILSEELNAS